MAKSFPNDLFKTLTKGASTLNISTKNIADKWYKELFVRNPNQLQWVDVEDERFINWMKSGS